MQQQLPVPNDLNAAFGLPIDETGLDAAFADDVEGSDYISDPDSIDEITKYITERGYHIRQTHPIGYELYPQGLWKINRVRREGGYSVIGDLVRYADYTQLREMQDVLRAGLLEELMRLIQGEGVREGPLRVGRPPIDPFGNPLVTFNNGDHGPLKAECDWIETHDKVFVQYLGADDNWPTGCWGIESDKGTDLYDDDQIKYIAHELLGMPAIPARTRLLNQSGFVDSDETLKQWGKAERQRKTQTALAKVGVNALIDEATGYQEDRGPDELRDMFVDYMSEDDPLDLDAAFADQPAGENTLEGWADIILEDDPLAGAFD